MADLNLYKILIASLSLLKYRLNEDSENLENTLNMIFSGKSFWSLPNLLLWFDILFQYVNIWLFCLLSNLKNTCRGLSIVSQHHVKTF